MQRLTSQTDSGIDVLCFDTLFHSSLPPEVYTYPVPHDQVKSPVPLRKYGFQCVVTYTHSSLISFLHADCSGLSYAYILKRTASFLKKPIEETSLIVCHLGSGASMCCIRNGKSIDTTVCCLLLLD